MGRPESSANWGWLAGLSALVVLSLPVWHPRLPGADIDSSWLATLNLFASSGLQFGRELVFTYGPLGYLQTPFFHPATYSRQIAFYLLVAGALAVAFGDVLPRRGEPARKAALASLFLVAFFLRTPDGHLLLVAAAFALRRSRLRPTGISPADLVFLTCLSAASLGKLIHLVAAVAVVTYAALVERARGGRPWRTPAIFLLMFGAWLLAARQSPGGLPAYLATSLEVVRGYGDVMGEAPGSATLVMAAACLAGVVFLAWLVGASRQGERLLLAATLATLVGLVFKLGLVRLYRTRVATELLLGIVVLAGLYLGWSADAAEKGRVALGAAGVALAAHLLVVALIPGIDLDRYLGLEVRRVANAAGRIADGSALPPYGGLRAARRIADEEVRRSEPMPEPTGAVDVFGTRQGAALAHGLDLRPRPVFQSHKAYTPRLAELNASFYRSDRAPDHVLARVESLLGFHPTSLDGPALLELARCYEPQARAGEFLLLHRAECAGLERRLVLETRLGLGERLDLRALKRERILWAEIDVRRSPLGMIIALLWAPGGLRIELGPRGEPSRSFRLAPGSGRAGFLLSPVVLDTDDLEGFIAPGATAPAPPSLRWLRIVEAGGVGGEIREEVGIRIWALEPSWAGARQR